MKFKSRYRLDQAVESRVVVYEASVATPSSSTPVDVLC